MSGILCAIRGGPDSRHTIDAAIRLAKEKQLPLYFLYVVNLDFLSRTSVSRVHVINEELQQMGEFILLSAQDRSSRHQVKAEGLIRHGKISEEIISTCQELKTEYVVLGRPKARTETNAFDLDRLAKFSQRITEETGAEVIFTEEQSS